MTARAAQASRTVAIKLGLCALLCMSILGLVHYLTSATIAESEIRQLEQTLNEVLGQTQYDNALPQDTLLATDPLLGSTAEKTIWRARLQNRAAGLVLSVTARNGYNGPIELLVGIAADGHLTGVRTISHRETPGLGDAIELQRSDWIKDFNGHSITTTPTERWTVSKLDGEFDQFTGATITPLAVISAVHNALLFFQREKEQLFER